MSLVLLGKLLKGVAAVCGALLLFTSAVVGQVEEVKLEVVGESSALRVEASGAPQKSWSFRDTYAGVVGLGQRIKKFEVFDERGQAVSAHQLAAGHYNSTVPASRIRYEVDLTPPARASQAALVSWLTKVKGLFLLSDLLPVPVKQPGSAVTPVSVTVNTPQGWAAYSDAEVTALRAYRFDDTADAVIVVAKNVRRTVRNTSGNLFKLLVEGTWPFSDQEAMDTLIKVIQLHSEVSAMPCHQVTLVLSTFPNGPAPANTWSAETRGCNVTLLMGQTPSRVGALAQLGNALTHETFHLWIPNGVALDGDYDWFYEGFTMYQAVRAAVRLGLVTWPEFLTAIARAYDGSTSFDAQSLSLIDASKQRWTTGAAAVYSKAMVGAFIYDLNLRQQTGGKRSLDDVYHRIMREHPRRSAVKKLDADGNVVAMTMLQSELSSAGFVERLIAAPISMDLKKELTPFGLRVEKLVRTHIAVSDDVNKRQRDLLKQLGYNEPRARRK